MNIPRNIPENIPPLARALTVVERHLRWTQVEAHKVATLFYQLTRLSEWPSQQLIGFHLFFSSIEKLCNKLFPKVNYFFIKNTVSIWIVITTVEMEWIFLCQTDPSFESRIFYCLLTINRTTKENSCIFGLKKVLKCMLSEETAFFALWFPDNATSYIFAT